MKKLALPLLLVFLFTGCAGGNAGPASGPSDSTPVPVPQETIRIMPEELLLLVGETASLVCESASGNVRADVTWIVEDERIATISENGEVTAVCVGKTTAIASRKDAPEMKAACPVTVSEQKALSFDGAKIEIKDKVEGFVSQDGTVCTMIFEMQAVGGDGAFQGQAMLQSVGVKDAGGSIPAVGMIGLVSNIEFTLAPPTPEEQANVNVGGNEITLAPLIDVKYSGTGTFRFIMTDVGFMALETQVQDDEVFLEVPYEVIVTNDDIAGIGFSAPDGQYLTFQGKFLRPE